MVRREQFNPGSRIMSFVVKGSKPDDRVKLKLLKVVQVGLVVRPPPLQSACTSCGMGLRRTKTRPACLVRPRQVAETFATFFVDNPVDPASLPASLFDQLPPNYAANYDPDRSKLRYRRNTPKPIRKTMCFANTVNYKPCLYNMTRFCV